MPATVKEVSREVFPYLRAYNDGTIERIAGTGTVPAGLDPETGVLSKDVVVVPEISVSARLYRPSSLKNNQKLPFLVYYHGGAFCIATPAEPLYHNCLNRLVQEANVLVLSVGYRLCPENPLSAAYEDSWAGLQWVSKQARGEDGTDKEAWLDDYADFGRVFLTGDSAGANIAHHMAFRAKESDLGPRVKIEGIVMIHPYFWGKVPIGVEVEDGPRRSMVDNWWTFVCKSERGCDDPYINPFVDGAPGLEGLGCDKVLVFLAEKDILCDRGKLYYENLVKSGWRGKAEMVEMKGEDHVG